MLAPGGRLALFWNVSEPAPDVAAELAAVYRSVETGLPFTPGAGSAVRGYEALLGRAEEGVRAAGTFAAPVRRSVAWSTRPTTAEWLDTVRTAGGHTRIAPERLAELLDGLGRVVDARGGRLELRWTTLVVLADRLGSSIARPRP